MVSGRPTFISAWRWWADSCRYCVRGIVSSGSERDGLLLLAKGVVAAVVAWSLAGRLLPATVTTFAPFTALLILQVTLYKSFRDCIQYLAAMLLGTALAAGLGATAGVHAWSLALLILCALAIGKTQRLGYQGSQVPVIGIFAFSSGHGNLSYIGHLVASVALGAGCALVAHMAVAPARRTPRSEQAVEALSVQTQRILTMLSEATAGQDTLGQGCLDDWARQCTRIAAEIDRARSRIDEEDENSRLNPRQASPGARHLLTHTHPTITLVDRALGHIRSVVRSLSHAVRSGDYDSLSRAFLDPYSVLLREAGDLLNLVMRQDADPGEVGTALREAERQCRDLQTNRHIMDAGSPVQSALCGSLITDVGRLVDELQQAVPEEIRIPPARGGQ
ncbi:aromatic acid exporter family protein [Streptomyces sp. NPDC059398]|uniref:aromatic acid exporter family protein n=1 Tax=Streptomyces sp. NPDC059398 TaxID=3346820 RepID=UPI0036860FA4